MAEYVDFHFRSEITDLVCDKIIKLNSVMWCRWRLSAADIDINHFSKKH